MDKKKKNRALDIARQCAKLVSDKKATDTIILKIKGLTEIADYFVICSGTSSRQMKTIADYVIEKLDKKGVKPVHFEADDEYTWLVLDFVDVILHIFTEEKREYYRLEHLWGDAGKIRIQKSKGKIEEV